MQVEKVRGMADTGGLGKPRPLDTPAKASQEEAAYGGSDAKCRTCTHFDGTSACDKVDGEIDPEGHSKYYEAGMTTAGPDDEAAEGEYR